MVARRVDEGTHELVVILARRRAVLHIHKAFKVGVAGCGSSKQCIFYMIMWPHARAAAAAAASRSHEWGGLWRVHPAVCGDKEAYERPWLEP